ncbi:MAG: sphingomyelin phosphodiesterase [Chitinophagales bacterium]|nr:sphingomyelin phosphodiesterase [Chitinophagales bacterium]
MNSILKHILLFAFFFAFTLNSSARNTITGNTTEECQDDDNDLKILSWNIYMLPAPVIRPGKLDRARKITEHLQQADFDIIVFQEAFHKQARRIIGKGLKEKYPFRYGPANKGGFSFKTNSGIWVVSRIPLNVLGTIQFKDCKGIDCYSRKGAMLLEGEANGKKFQILGTHLQSEDADLVREKQMDQIFLELLTKYHEPEVPQIICGDLNTESDIKEHYCAMLDCLDAEDGEFDSVEKFTYDGVNNEIAQSYGAKTKFTLDYILFRANGAKVKTMKRFVSVLKRGKKHLSDHYGVACEVKF